MQLLLNAALGNPLTQDRVDVVRRQEVIDRVYGENKTQDQTFQAVPATVYPGGMNKLDRRPEAQSSEKVIELVSRFAFRQASPGYQADIIIWKGDRYLVDSVLDYSTVGAGFTQAMATALPVLQTAPQTLPGDQT